MSVCCYSVVAIKSTASTSIIIVSIQCTVESSKNMALSEHNEHRIPPESSSTHDFLATRYIPFPDTARHWLWIKTHKYLGVFLDVHLNSRTWHIPMVSENWAKTIQQPFFEREMPWFTIKFWVKSVSFSLKNQTYPALTLLGIYSDPINHQFSGTIWDIVILYI